MIKTWKNASWDEQIMSVFFVIVALTLVVFAVAAIFTPAPPPVYSVPVALQTVVDDCANSHKRPGKRKGIYTDKFMDCLIDSGVGFNLHGDPIAIGGAPHVNRTQSTGRRRKRQRNPMA